MRKRVALWTAVLLSVAVAGGVVVVKSSPAWFVDLRWNVRSSVWIQAGSPCERILAGGNPKVVLSPVPAQKRYGGIEALGCAISARRFDVVEFLVENGYDVNWREPESRFPMVVDLIPWYDEVVSDELVRIAEFLGEHGIDYCAPVILANGREGSPLDYARERERPGVEELYDRLGWEC